MAVNGRPLVQDDIRGAAKGVDEAVAVLGDLTERWSRDSVMVTVWCSVVGVTVREADHISATVGRLGRKYEVVWWRSGAVDHRAKGLTCSHVSVEPVLRGICQPHNVDGLGGAIVVPGAGIHEHAHAVEGAGTTDGHAEVAACVDCERERKVAEPAVVALALGLVDGMRVAARYGILSLDWKAPSRRWRGSRGDE